MWERMTYMTASPARMMGTTSTRTSSRWRLDSPWWVRHHTDDVHWCVCERGYRWIVFLSFSLGCARVHLLCLHLLLCLLNAADQIHAGKCHAEPHMILICSFSGPLFFPLYVSTQALEPLMHIWRTCRAGLESHSHWQFIEFPQLYLLKK